MILLKYYSLFYILERAYIDLGPSAPPPSSPAYVLYAPDNEEKMINPIETTKSHCKH